MSSTPVAEITFYTDEQAVRVTNTRLIVGSTTFAMGNITSVSRAVEEPSRLGPMIVTGIGVVFVILGLSEIPKNVGLTLLGCLSGAAAALWWRMQKTVYSLRVSSSSGESSPIASTDRARIEKIVQAVNEAIIARG